jgi:hypothetical protein
VEVNLAPEPRSRPLAAAVGAGERGGYSGGAGAGFGVDFGCWGWVAQAVQVSARAGPAHEEDPED